MSLFGMMGDLEDDPIFGHHMRSMRQMNNMMNSLFADPFGMFGGGAFGAGFGAFPNNALMGPNRNLMNPQMNRLLGGDTLAIPDSGIAYSSSSVFSMSSGPDGRPQVYQATSSTRAGPGGVRETRRTVQDSRSGTKKMAIGHHIGERAHIIEKEQNLHTGQREERQEFINLEDEEAEDFDREFQQRARQGTSNGRLQITEVPNVPAILPAIQSSEEIQQNSNNRNRMTSPHVPRHRAIRSSPLASNASTSPTRHSQITTSVHPHPYQPQMSRKSRALKGHHNQH
jgi:hypothetical protein